jgi:hypothetical protein
MSTITKEQIEKLPKWAQEHMRDLQRQRDTAVAALRKWTDSQTESPISIMEYECTGETQGPSRYDRYVHAHGLTIKWHGIRLDVRLNDDGPQHECGIGLQWSDVHQRSLQIAMVPKSYQSVDLIAKENMR